MSDMTKRLLAMQAQPYHAFRGAAMNPTLPGALVEREKVCDLCRCPTTDWTVAEIRGGTYTLCMDCKYDNIDLIEDALAKADADGASEDAAQEEL